jgi:hypothetical protein
MSCRATRGTRPRANWQQSPATTAQTRDFGPWCSGTGRMHAGYVKDVHAHPWVSVGPARSTRIVSAVTAGLGAALALPIAWAIGRNIDCAL